MKDGLLLCGPWKHCKFEWQLHGASYDCCRRYPSLAPGPTGTKHVLNKHAPVARTPTGTPFDQKENARITIERLFSKSEVRVRFVHAREVVRGRD